MYFGALETIDDTTGCSTYSLLDPKEKFVFTKDFDEGLGQHFDLEEHTNGLLDFSSLREEDVAYVESDQVPLIIVLEVNQREYLFSLQEFHFFV